MAFERFVASAASSQMMRIAFDGQGGYQPDGVNCLLWTAARLATRA
jgi:hypothetical protein